MGTAGRGGFRRASRRLWRSGAAAVLHRLWWPACSPGLQLRVLRRAGTAQHAFKGHGQAGESVQLNVWVPFGQLLGAQVPWIEAAVQDSGQEQELRLMSAALTAGGGGKGCTRSGECPPCKG